MASDRILKTVYLQRVVSFIFSLDFSLANLLVTVPALHCFSMTFPSPKAHIQQPRYYTVNHLGNEFWAESVLDRGG